MCLGVLQLLAAVLLAVVDVSPSLDWGALGFVRAFFGLVQSGSTVVVVVFGGSLEPWPLPKDFSSPSSWQKASDRL